MAKEKIMTFVEARSKLSEIVDRVAESGDAYVVSKRQKPRAVIIGIDRYRELSGTSKYLKTVRGKKIIKLEGIATAVGDIDEAIHELRKSRIEAVIKKFR
jgi:prevent-host-death family protein